MKHKAYVGSSNHLLIGQSEKNELPDQGDSEVAFDASDEAFLDICEILNQGDDQTASSAFDDSYLVICDLLNHIDWEDTGNHLEEDLSDISELRARLRKEALQGLLWITVAMCSIILSFAIVSV